MFKCPVCKTSFHDVVAYAMHLDKKHTPDSVFDSLQRPTLWDRIRKYLLRYSG